MGKKDFTGKCNRRKRAKINKEIESIERSISTHKATRPGVFWTTVTIPFGLNTEKIRRKVLKNRQAKFAALAVYPNADLSFNIMIGKPESQTCAYCRNVLIT